MIYIRHQRRQQQQQQLSLRAEAIEPGLCLRSLVAAHGNGTGSDHEQGGATDALLDMMRGLRVWRVTVAWTHPLLPLFLRNRRELHSPNRTNATPKRK